VRKYNVLLLERQREHLECVIL